MQYLRNSLKQLQISIRSPGHTLKNDRWLLRAAARHLSGTKDTNSDIIMARVLGLVRKYDKIDGNKGSGVNVFLECLRTTCSLSEKEDSARRKEHRVSPKNQPSQALAKAYLETGKLDPRKTEDKIQVTETSHFQKDLGLDSLDKVELVMAFEQEFSVEIPDEKADKLACCADVVNYIISEAKTDDGESHGP